MKRAPLIIALILSIVLIGGATWQRFSPRDKQPIDLAVIENPSALDDRLGSINNIWPTAVDTSTSTSTPEVLTSTDLIGRQLINDYVALSMSGQATEENITALANRYAEQIPSLISAPTLKATEIIVTSDSKEAFQAYADRFTIIYKEYANFIKVNAGSSASTAGSGQYADAKVFNRAFGDILAKLKVLPVPTSLAQTHLKLINIYLSNIAVTQTLSDSSADASVAFASAIVFKQNISTEQKLIEEIDRILATKGI